MKTYQIKELLKKEFLIIELPEGSYPEITSRLLAINHSDGSIKIFKGSYTLLGKPSEIREEDAEELVEPFDLSYYVDYNHPSRGAYTITATESLLSAIESVIFWDVNPISKQLGFIGNVSEIDKQIALQKQKRRFDDAELRTFDRNRSIILVKN